MKHQPRTVPGIVDVALNLATRDRLPAAMTFVAGPVSGGFDMLGESHG